MKSRRPKNPIVFVAALLCAVVLSGCSDPKAKVAGNYEIDKAAFKAAAEAHMKSQGENSPDSMGVAMFMQMIDQMTITMNLNADGTASMSMSAMGNTETSSGTWTLAGKAITIVAAPAGETPETITGTVSGETIALRPPKEQNMPFDMVFKRKA